MNDILHMNVNQIRRTLGEGFEFGHIHPFETNQKLKNDRLLWEQIYKQLGPEHTLDLMSYLPDLEKSCRLFCWACLTHFDVLKQLDHSENCLTTLRNYAHGLIEKKHLQAAHLICIKSGRKLDYDTEQVLRQANAALLWSIGIDDMFSPSEMLRRIAQVGTMQNDGSIFMQHCLDEFDALIKRVDSVELYCSES